jgi:hypothetical protein
MVQVFVQPMMMLSLEDEQSQIVGEWRRFVCPDLYGPGLARRAERQSWTTASLSILRFWSGGRSYQGINMNILVLLFFVFILPLVALLGRLYMPQLSSSFSNII